MNVVHTHPNCLTSSNQWYHSLVDHRDWRCLIEHYERTWLRTSEMPLQRFHVQYVTKLHHFLGRPWSWFSPSRVPQNLPGLACCVSWWQLSINRWEVKSHITIIRTSLVSLWKDFHDVFYTVYFWMLWHGQVITRPRFQVHPRPQIHRLP